VAKVDIDEKGLEGLGKLAVDIRAGPFGMMIQNSHSGRRGSLPARDWASHAIIARLPLPRGGAKRGQEFPVGRFWEEAAEPEA
jgi:hypothetical protein